MRRADQLRRADRLRYLGAWAYSERDKRRFLMVAMKLDEIRWFGDAPEDRDMTQMEFMRFVMQRFLENAPARLLTGREVLTLFEEPRFDALESQLLSEALLAVK